MAEIFSIGSPFGAPACPPGWVTTAKGNCAGPGGKASPAAINLQRALASIGRAAGDGVLSRIKADGVIGPGTAAAVNRAMTAHVGPGQAPAALRTGRLGIPEVALNSVALTGLLNAEASRRAGGAPRAAAATAPAAAACPPGWKTSPAGNCSGTPAVALQRALAALGRAKGNRTLAAVKADGVIGPGTVSAVNQALGANLTKFQVAQNAGQLTQAIIAGTPKGAPAPVARGGGAVPGGVSVPRCPAGWSTSTSGNCSGSAARPLQQALQLLGRATGDKSLLAVQADGVIGPGTSAAANRALTAHVGAGQAPAALRTGALTRAIVALNAPGITQLVMGEVARRAGKPVPKTRVVVAPGTPEAVPGGTALPEEGVRLPSAENVPGPVPSMQPQGPDDVFRPVPDAVPGGGGGIPAETGPGAEPGAQAEQKKFPWLWVGIGAGVLAAGGLTYYLVKGRKGSTKKRLESEGFSPEEAAAVAGFGAALGEITKKDFIAMADILCQYGAHPQMISSFSSYFATQNPRFDTRRFEKAATSCAAHRRAA